MTFIQQINIEPCFKKIKIIKDKESTLKYHMSLLKDIQDYQLTNPLFHIKNKVQNEIKNFSYEFDNNEIYSLENKTLFFYEFLRSEDNNLKYSLRNIKPHKNIYEDFKFIYEFTGKDFTEIFSFKEFLNERLTYYKYKNKRIKIIKS